MGRNSVSWSIGGAAAIDVEGARVVDESAIATSNLWLWLARRSGRPRFALLILGHCCSDAGLVLVARDVVRSGGKKSLGILDETVS